MAQYRYRGINDENRPVEGLVEAASALEAVSVLRRREIRPTLVEDMESRPRSVSRKKALGAEDLALFNEQLSAIVKSGLPLAPSLEALCHDVQSRRLKRVLNELRSDIEQGLPISEALSRHPESFSPVYLSVVRAGEASGNLSSALLALTEHSARGTELRYRLQEALAYPLLVLVVATMVLTLFLTKVVPVMHGMGVFRVPVISANQPIPHELPLPTRLVLATSAFLRNEWLLLASAAMGLVLVVYVFNCHYKARSTPIPAIDRWKLRMPVFGSLFYEASMARFIRALGMMLKGRLPLPDSLRLASVASGNDALREAGWRAAEGVESGRPLSQSLEEAGYFDRSFPLLIRTSEERGDVEQTLETLAEAYERRAERRSRRIVTMSGPVVTLMAAAVVVTLMLAIYLPLLSNAFGWLFNSGESMSG